jgi:hypothetical protein
MRILYLYCLLWSFEPGLSKAPAPLPRKVQHQQPTIANGYYTYYWNNIPWHLFLYPDGRSLCLDSTGWAKYQGIWEYNESPNPDGTGILKIIDSGDNFLTWNTWEIKITNTKFTKRGKLAKANGTCCTANTGIVSVVLIPGVERVRIPPKCVID